MCCLEHMDVTCLYVFACGHECLAPKQMSEPWAGVKEDGQLCLYCNPQQISIFPITNQGQNFPQGGALSLKTHQMLARVPLCPGRTLHWVPQPNSSDTQCSTPSQEGEGQSFSLHSCLQSNCGPSTLTALILHILELSLLQFTLCNSLSVISSAMRGPQAESGVTLLAPAVTAVVGAWVHPWEFPGMYSKCWLARKKTRAYPRALLLLLFTTFYHPLRCSF